MAIRQLSPREKLTKARLITAVKTPYQRNGKFDLVAYDALVQHQIENGVEGLIVGGTTGEGQLMSWDEHVMLIAHTVNHFGNDILVIGNTGSNSTREALHATQQGFAVGMHASLQINPYYGKTSETGLLHHLNAVLDEGPGIVYNVPARQASCCTTAAVAVCMPTVPGLSWPLHLQDGTGYPRPCGRKACAA